MSKATLFTDGENQVVKLPKGVQFEGVAEVEIKREGESIILTPKRKSCKSLDDSPKGGKSIVDMLSMPDAGEVDFDPPPLKSPLFRPVEFSDVSD